MYIIYWRIEIKVFVKKWSLFGVPVIRILVSWCLYYYGGPPPIFQASFEGCFEGFMRCSLEPNFQENKMETTYYNRVYVE